MSLGAEVIRAGSPMSFALSEAVVILVTLVRSVHLSLRPSFVPELKQRVTLRPAAGMPMRIQSR